MAERARAFLVEFLVDVFVRRALGPDDGRCSTAERWAPVTAAGSAPFFLPPEVFVGVRAEWAEDPALLDAVESGWAPSIVCERLVADESTLTRTAKITQLEPNFIIRSST
jgi:hypothetical protein